MIVLLDIKKPMHREYLNYLFAYEGNAFSVFRNNEFGKALCSKVRKADFPVKHQESPHTVRLRLPQSRAIRTHRNHFLYYSTEDQHQLNDLLDVLFNIDFESYYHIGIEMGLMQKEVIQNFIISRKLVSMIGDVETLKKRQYRKEKNTLEKLQNKLLQKIHYRDRLIKKTLQSAYKLNASVL